MKDETFRKYSKKKLAEELGINVSTMSGWIKAGLPTHNFEEFCKWIRLNKKTNRKAIDNLKNWERRALYKREKDREKADAINGKKSEDIAIEEAEAGSAHALQRLRTDEAETYTKMQRAEKEKDAQLAELHHTKWLKTCNALRQFEASLAKEKQEIGEVVQKSEMVKVFQVIGMAINLGEERYLDQTSSEFSGMSRERDIRQHGKGKLYDAITDSLNEAVLEDKIEAWIVEAMEPLMGSGE